MIIIGHRGARKEAPENTVEGFVYAQRHGCFHFELDIQLSSDLELVVYHDTTLKRTSGIRRTVKSISLTELEKIDARLNTPGWPFPCYISSLESIVSAIPDTISWQFEIKPDSQYRMKIIFIKLQELIERYQLFERVTITSSNQRFLHMVKVNSKLKIGLVAEFGFTNPVNNAVKLGCDLLVLNEKLASVSRVNRAFEHNLSVSCWTVNSVPRMTELSLLGVQSIITDLPSLALKYFPAQ